MKLFIFDNPTAYYKETSVVQAKTLDNALKLRNRLDPLGRPHVDNVDPKYLVAEYNIKSKEEKVIVY